MAVSLRDVLDEELNIETEELITDAVIKRMYNKAVHWYRKYRLFPRTNPRYITTHVFKIITCFFTIENDRRLEIRKERNQHGV